MNTDSHDKRNGSRYRYTPYLIACLLIAMFLRFGGLDTTPLIGDEAYYWQWSRHLDWSYVDNPAGIGIMVALSRFIAGETPFGIRWLNGLLGVGSVLMTYKVGQAMFSRATGLFAALLVTIGAPYLIIGRFVYSNGLLLFLMLCNLWYAWLWLTKAKKVSSAHQLRHVFIGFGITMALLMNIKYNAYVYFGAVGLTFLLDHRTMLKSPYPRFALLIAVLSLLPVLVWNANYDWVSFRWQLAHFTTTSPGNPSENGVLHVLLSNGHHAFWYITPPLFVLGLMGLGQLKNPAERLLTSIAVFMLSPIIISPANSPRNLITGLVPLLILAVHRVMEHGAAYHHGASSGLRAVASHVTPYILRAAFFLLLCLTAAYGVGTLLALTESQGARTWNRWPDYLSSSAISSVVQDTAGYKEISRVLTAYPDPIFTLDYHLAGQLAHHMGRPATTGWIQYQLWEGRDNQRPPPQVYTVISAGHLSKACVTAHLTDVFTSVSEAEIVTFPVQGQTRQVHIWRVRGPKHNPITIAQHLDFLKLREVCR